MANVLVNENSLTAIGNAIRSKNGETTTYKPAEMAPAITALPSGGSETLETEFYLVRPSATTDTFDLTPYAESKDDIVAIFWTAGVSLGSNGAVMFSYFANNETPGTRTDKYRLQEYTVYRSTSRPSESFFNSVTYTSHYGISFYTKADNKFMIRVGDVNENSYIIKMFSTHYIIIVTKKKGA